MDTHAGADCATCGAVASNKCGGCKTSAYRSKECQVKDWPTHKLACKDIQLEKQLSRIASIAYPAYQTFREDTWDTPIVKIEDTEDALVTYDGDQALNKNFFVEFPHHLIQNERAKSAVFSMMMCNEPLAWMHDLVEELVRGLRVRVDEVVVELGSVPRKTIAVHPNGLRQANWTSYSHALLRFTSIKTKTQWVIDFGGGQYGINQALWKWGDYSKSFVNLTAQIKVSPFGTTKALFDMLGELDGNPGLAYGMVGEVANVMGPAAATAAQAGAFNISALVSDPDDQQFLGRKTALLCAFHSAVRSYIQSPRFDQKIRAEEAFERRFPGRSYEAVAKASEMFFAKYPARMEFPNFMVDGVRHVYF
ncbi:hypothetical protein FB567DRAFT_224064 [Paraphoma chrysanthemicola]|uniref:MYND-type domain-containing protein n=1 Tax=Paraphoma chrysanthemicola TaxID=798071 RepID=A0A8K0VSN9_9PLEO|nr:hypothetical protein FB567DRAFT_224064 [Paraphoma chrysanthemicola]